MEERRAAGSVVYATFDRHDGVMLEHLNLTFLERIAVRLLAKSPRIGLLVVKPYGSRLTFITKDMHDPVDIVGSEPITLQLERLYHQASYGDDA